MKLLSLSLISLTMAGPTKYLSVQRRRMLRTMVQHEIAEMSDSLTPSVAMALPATWEAFTIPSMIPERIFDRMDDNARTQCEGDGCSAGTVDLSPLFGYACWCFFGNVNSNYGRGPPLDGYDAICQKLVLCYRCILVDADNESDDCDPYTQAFDATVIVQGLQGISNITTSCQTNNADNCAWRTCACTMTLTTNLINLAFDPDTTYNTDYKHSEGFDYALDCPQQGKSQDRQCCGFYPNRRTYDRHNERACCHERSIYNPLRHQCCDDGSHVGLGSRC